MNVSHQRVFDSFPAVRMLLQDPGNLLITNVKRESQHAENRGIRSVWARNLLLIKRSIGL